MRIRVTRRTKYPLDARDMWRQFDCLVGREELQRIGSWKNLIRSKTYQFRLSYNCPIISQKRGFRDKLLNRSFYNITSSS